MTATLSRPMAYAEVISPVTIGNVLKQREPSRPVSVLLRQADRMWGKRFSEVTTMIPPDLLQA